MEWPDDMCLLFISDVESLPVLWNPCDPSYKIGRRKSEAWRSLSEKYNGTEMELKGKWQSLQASYRREKSKEMTHAGMGSCDKIKSKWFAYKAMQFLGDRYTPRTPKITAQEEIFHMSEDSECGSKAASDNEESDSILALCASEDDSVPSSSKRVHTKNFMSPKFVPRKKQKSKGKINGVYDIPKPTAASERVEEIDETEAYGEYVARTLRKLDNRSRIVAKHYINQVLFGAELGEYRQAFSSGLNSSSFGQSSAEHIYPSEHSLSNWSTVEEHEPLVDNKPSFTA